MGKKVNFTVLLEPEQEKALKEISERTRVPVSVYIREGVDLIISKHSKELNSQM